MTEDELRAKQRRYTADYRRKNPEAVVRDRVNVRARHRALARLSLLHPEEYLRLLNEEIEKSWAEEKRRTSA
ncbi:MAG TPA: hypothetical protein VKZ82_12935 [Nonomuraea sp.]|nr:hypothetical protein [Nonomuraea sp.]